jgi:GNAT superfamily N-acetyltransferase
MPTVTSENKAEHDRKFMEKRGLLKSEKEESISDKKVGTNEERTLMESKFGSTKASYTIHHPDKTIDIGSVRTSEKDRGQGNASKMMNYLHGKADELGYDTKLLASPLDKKTKLDKLVEFYKKHGYELTGKKGNMAGEPEMIRKFKKLTGK